MNNFLKKFSNVGVDVACYALMGAFVFTSVGALIWSVQWVFKLLGGL